MRLSQQVGMCVVLCAINVASAAQPRQHWVASWGAAQQVPEPHNELPADQWRDASLRQIVHMSLGGSRLRLWQARVDGRVGESARCP